MIQIWLFLRRIKYGIVLNKKKINKWNREIDDLFGTKIERPWILQGLLYDVM